MMKKIAFLILATLSVISCQKENNSLPPDDIKINENEIVIKYGRVSGWCAGTDSLVVNSNDLWYVLNLDCGQKITTQHKTITQAEKETLLKELDLEEFSKIELNTCNVCVDGTDYWLSVKNGSYFHNIRYGYNDSAAISNIKPFIDELNKLKAKFE